ncbi:phosphatidylinositol N-acetyglucosaminlytransferase subunit P-like protein [Actinidia rufa]|uniref:Phosphatidylinositol N-acetyglucosaminlytransferase subunit P-like protein n=1 Tax=Actinidia rufa TaxID=165716 RepID=A0A7J0G7R8_9ERIC|nr:phosphatidylinositol N-acetyglucosaminlytransferase subunit P-like protein [Actinidia rufa]
MQYEKYQSGCIWGFISIFDFRHGRSLLADSRHTSRQVVGAGYSRSKLQMPTNSKGASKEIYDGEERDSLVADNAKTSVKELMEEEMFSEQEQKQPVSTADIQAKDFDSECKGRVKKNRKRKKKPSKHCKLDAAENLGPENSCHQDSEDKTLKNLDLEVVITELCQKIYPQSSSMKNDSIGDLDIQSQQSYSVFDEKLIEAIKLFVDLRFTDGKHPTEDEKIEQSKEFKDALQTLSSNKELILKLLKDPDSLLVKHIEDLEGAQLEKEQSLLYGEVKTSKPSEPVTRKQHNFFRRKSKTEEKIPSNEQVNCRASSRIVILKPGLPSVESFETEANLTSSSQSHHSFGTKVHTERNVSQFSFTEIKRKLKHAMGKERHSAPSDNITRSDPCTDQNSGNNDKGNGGAKGGWNSPNRNHFYNEKFARPARSIKNKDKSCKPKDTETSMGNRTDEYPMPREYNNIYIEAKKHLLEMMSNGDEIEEISSIQLPKTLGRILSLPEFNLSPICSPSVDKAHSFVMTQRWLSPRNNSYMVSEGQLTQEKDVSHLDSPRQNLNSQSCIAEDPEDKGKSCNSNSDVLDELNSANAVEKAVCSTGPEKSSGGITFLHSPTYVEKCYSIELLHRILNSSLHKTRADDAKSVEITDASVQEETIGLDMSDEQCGLSVIRDDQNSDHTEVCDKEEHPQYLKLVRPCLDVSVDSLEQDQLLSSPVTSPRSCSTTKHVDLEGANESTERPSPVSVLEPLFPDDDISSTIIKFQAVEPSIQPQQIHFEERVSSATNQEIFIRVSMEDEESAFEYVEAVLLASDLNWDEFLSRWLSSDQILDVSLFDEMELFSSRSFHDQKLLFDCTNEVLEEVCEHYFGCSPWVSFVKHNIGPIPRGKDLIHEVWDGVEWNLLPQPSPHTLDQIVRKDMEKPRTWMDLRSDVEGIGIEIGEVIFEELVEDVILSFVKESLDIDSFMFSKELHGRGSKQIISCLSRMAMTSHHDAIHLGLRLGGGGIDGRPCGGVVAAGAGKIGKWGGRMQLFESFEGGLCRGGLVKREKGGSGVGGRYGKGDDGGRWWVVCGWPEGEIQWPMVVTGKRGTEAERLEEEERNYWKREDAYKWLYYYFFFVIDSFIIPISAILFYLSIGKALRDQISPWQETNYLCILFACAYEVQGTSLFLCCYPNSISISTDVVDSSVLWDAFLFQHLI